MDDGVTVQLRGNDDCVAAFRELREFVRGNLFSQSVRAAATIMLEEIIARAPVATGRLVSNLRVAVKKAAASVHARVVVNPLAYYWYFVEFGHSGPGGSYVPPHPFVTVAFESRRETAAQQVIDTFSKGLDRAEARARRAGAL